MPDDVADQLLDDIVDGELVPGETLPAERALAEALGVSRPTVRQALTRLAHAGVLSVRQGEATTVRDFRRSAGMDLLPRLLLRDGAPDPATVRGVLEVRLAIAPDVARRCAARRREDLVTRLHELTERMADLDGDPAALQPLTHEFWHLVVDGSDNVVYRLLFNALEAAYLPVLDLLVDPLAGELTDLAGYRAVVAAIERGDAAGAAQATRRTVAKGTTAALQILDRLDQ